MSELIERLREEPVRLRIYTVASLIAIYLVSKGIIDVTDLEFIVGIAAVILGVERTRAKVSPVRA